MIQIHWIITSYIVSFFYLTFAMTHVEEKKNLTIIMHWGNDSDRQCSGITNSWKGVTLFFSKFMIWDNDLNIIWNTF